MAHLSKRGQFSTQGSFLRNAEMIIHRLADDRSIHSVGPALADKMLHPAHHPFLIDQNAQKNSPFERNAGLTDRLDGIDRCCQIPLGITSPSAVDSISRQPSFIRAILPF